MVKIWNTSSKILGGTFSSDMWQQSSKIPLSSSSLLEFHGSSMNPRMMGILAAQEGFTVVVVTGVTKKNNVSNTATAY